MATTEPGISEVISFQIFLKTLNIWVTSYMSLIIRTDDNDDISFNWFISLNDVISVSEFIILFQESTILGVRNFV